MKTNTDKTINPFEIDLSGKTPEEIRDIMISFRQLQAEALEAQFGEHKDMFRKMAEKEISERKLAQERAQKEAVEFYANERVLIVKVGVVTKDGIKVETEGTLPLSSPELANLPLIRGWNGDKSKIVPLRGKHLELRNTNVSLPWGKEDSGKSANFNITMKIGDTDVVEFRVPSAKEIKKEHQEGAPETFSKKGEKCAVKQEKANKADQLQTDVSID